MESPGNLLAAKVTPAILGSLGLFSGCIQLVRETRRALTAVDREMSFALELVGRRSLPDRR